MMKRIYIILFLAGIISLPAHSQENISLDKAINLALKNNPKIHAMQHQSGIADAKKKQVEASFYPKADVISKYLYSNNLPNFYPLLGVKVPVMNGSAPNGDYVMLHPMAPFMNNARDLFMTDVNVVYPIYTGNKRKNALTAMDLLKDAYNVQTQESESDLVLKVKNAFYNYLMLNDVISVYEKALTQYHKHLDLAQKAYEQGVRSEFDILNFKSKIADFNSKIIELKGKRQIVVTGLKSLMALPMDKEVQFSGNIGDFFNKKELLGHPQLSDLQQNYLKLHYLKKMQELIATKQKITWADRLPVVFSFGNYHIYHGKDFPPFDKTWRDGYAIGVGAKLNLFDGNKTRAKIDELKAKSMMLSDYQDGLKLKLRFDYKKVQEEIAALKARIDAQKSNLEVSQKAYEIAQTGYKNGVTTNITLNDAYLKILKVQTGIINLKKQILAMEALLEYYNGQNK